MSVIVSVSKDGRDWRQVLVGPCFGAGYPAVIQTSDREVHMTFSDVAIRHVVMRPDILCGLPPKPLGKPKPAGNDETNAGTR